MLLYRLPAPQEIMIDFHSAQRIEALKYLESVNDQLLHEVKILINEYSGLNLPTQFVRILAGSWILSFSHNLFVAFSNYKQYDLRVSLLTTHVVML